MSDLTEDAILDASVRQSDLLLYDYFKHMTTLSLLTLGGVLSISQTAGVEIKMQELIPVLALVSIGGAFSLHGLETVVRARTERRTLPWWTRWYRSIAGGSFALGTGLFVGIFWNATP